MADNKAYAIFSTQKVHSKTLLRQMYEHHYRIKDCPNADKDMKEENDYRVVPKGDFIQAFDKRLQELDYYKTHNFRSNGVMGYDCLMAYSRKANNWLDVEKWKEDNVKWLESYFGKENVVSVVFHYDEAGRTEGGAIHGHAFVIPVDPSGKVNASYYTNGQAKLSMIQDSYAAAMKGHRLERGIEKTPAHHSPPKRFYKELHNAVYGTEMPVRNPGENYSSYIDRLKDAWRDERAAHVRELKEKDREITEIRSQYRPDPDKDRLITSLTRKVDAYREKEEQMVREFGSSNGAVRLARTMKLLNEGIEHYPDTETAAKVSDDAVRLIAWAEEQAKKKERQHAREKEERNIQDT